MKRLPSLAILLALPLVLAACPGDDSDDDYQPPEDTGAMGPSASAPLIQCDGPSSARLG